MSSSIALYRGSYTTNLCDVAMMSTAVCVGILHFPHVTAGQWQRASAAFGHSSILYIVHTHDTIAGYRCTALRWAL